MVKPKAAVDTQPHLTVLTPPLDACFLEAVISSTHHALLPFPFWNDGREMPLGEPRQGSVLYRHHSYLSVSATLPVSPYQFLAELLMEF